MICIKNIDDRKTILVRSQRVTSQNVCIVNTYISPDFPRQHTCLAITVKVVKIGIFVHIIVYKK